MRKNKKGESLIGILIGMFILGLVLLGISNIIITSRKLNSDTINENAVSFLKNSFTNIIYKSDLSNLNIGEDFYLSKDKASKIISILTGSSNSGSMYIDRHGYKVNDISSFSGYIYLMKGTVINIDNSLGFKNIIFDLTVEQY